MPLPILGSIQEAWRAEPIRSWNIRSRHQKRSKTPHPMSIFYQPAWTWWRQKLNSSTSRSEIHAEKGTQEVPRQLRFHTDRLCALARQSPQRTDRGTFGADPHQSEYFAMEDWASCSIPSSVQNLHNEDLEIEGLLMTMYDSRLRLSNQVVEEVKNHFQQMPKRSFREKWLVKRPALDRTSSPTMPPAQVRSITNLAQEFLKKFTCRALQPGTNKKSEKHWAKDLPPIEGSAGRRPDCRRERS